MQRRAGRIGRSPRTYRIGDTLSFSLFSASAALGINDKDHVVGWYDKPNNESVVVGTVPLKLLLNTRIGLGAENELARDVLIRALDATDSRVTWKLFFGPDVRMYALNLQVIPERNTQDQPAPPRNESHPADDPALLNQPR